MVRILTNKSISIRIPLVSLRGGGQRVHIDIYIITLTFISFVKTVDR